MKCYFLSGGYRCCLATLVLIFLSVSFISPLTSLQPSALIISPHDMAKPSTFVLIYHLNNGQHITLFEWVFISRSVPSGDALYHSENVHVCCCNLLFLPFCQSPAFTSKYNNRSQDGLVNDLLSFRWYIPVLQ